MSRPPVAENGLKNEENVKEWEDIQCPICVEHPHNAILLLCSSYDKGCRTFMCDTSSHHSNCFDLFKKSCTKEPDETTGEGTTSSLALPLISDPLSILLTSAEITRGITPAGWTPSLADTAWLEYQAQRKLMCPMCRGEIKGWGVVESAHCFMDGKARTCRYENCDFSGSYSDLQEHVRTAHPFGRPTTANPVRQGNWTRFEMENDFLDLNRSLQSPIMGENPVETPESNNEQHIAYLLFSLMTNGRSSRSSGPSVTGGENELPSVPSIASSGNGVNTVPRRSRRRSRGESPNEEVHDSDGGPVRRRGLQRRSRGRTSPEN